MRNHESVGRGEDFNQGNVAPESEAREYEKRLERVSDGAIYLADENAERLLADLTWRGIGGLPRERYNSEHRQTEIDRLRLYNEAKILCNYSLEESGSNIPQSKFLRHLADTCQYGYRTVDTVPLSNSEKEHFFKTNSNFIQYLSDDGPMEQSFNGYLKSLLKMCESAYGKGSRAEMYLCDDLNQLLAPNDYQSSKTEIMDRLMERKFNAAQIKVREIHNGRRKIGIAGFTAALDLPDGIENHSLKELVEEGVPSLYGYSDEKN